MASFSMVQPGDKFRPSATLSNAVRQHLNETNGFGAGFVPAKNAAVIRVPIYNSTSNAISAGMAVSLDLTGTMREDAYPAVAYSSEYPCFGVAIAKIEPGKVGDCVLSGIAAVTVSGGTGSYVKPVSGGTFEFDEDEGVPAINISGGTVAVVLLGNYRGLSGKEYDDGVGILITGGSPGEPDIISWNVSQGLGITITGGTSANHRIINANITGDNSTIQVTGGTDGSPYVVSYIGGGSSGSEFYVPIYSNMSMGGLPEHSLGRAITFIVPVKAGTVGFWDEGGGAVGCFTDLSGDTTYFLENREGYPATSDGFLRVSVYDDGSSPGECLRFFSQTGGLPLYKYSFNVSGITSTISGGTASISLTGGTGSVRVVGGGIISIYGNTNGEIVISATGGTGGATGIASTVSGGTAYVTLTGGTGAVKFRGEGSVEIDGIRRYATPQEISDWGRRYNPATGEMDGDWKNAGWRGIIPLGNGDVMTEYSVSSEIGGVEVGYPLIVPDTTNEELEIIKQAILLEDDSLITQSIIDKAVAWAESRIEDGKSPFYNGDSSDEQYRKIDNLIIVRGSGATGIESTVSGSTAASINLTGGTGSVIVEPGNANISIDGSTNGRIRISATGGGGGGGDEDAVIIYQEEHTELGQITAQTNKKYYIALFGALYYDSESYNYVCQYYITYDHSTTPYTIVRHKTDYSDLESYWQGDGYSLELVLPTPNEDCYVDICLFAFSNILISSAKPIYNYQGAPCAQPYMLGNRNVKLVYIANDNGGRWYLYGN